MNRFDATVTEVRLNEGVSLVRFDAEGHELTMVGLEPPAGVEAGAKVVLGVKATHILLALTPVEGSTLRNTLPVTIEKIDAGEILASVLCRCDKRPLEAIVPRDVLKSLDLKPGEKAWAHFFESELAILEVLL